MFEFLREWMKSTAVKRQETLNAYLDGELSPQNRVAFEQLLADDAALQQELADRQLIKSQLQQLPRVAVPRNFILDANAYRKPAKRPLITYYPVLRGATALTAVIFIFTLGWSMIGSGGSYNADPAQESAMESVMETAVEEQAAAEIMVEDVVEEMEDVVEEMEMPAEAEAVEMERSTPADGVAAAEEAPLAEVPAADMDAAVGDVVVVETAVFTPTITPTATATPTPTATPVPAPPPEPTRSAPSLLTTLQIIQIGLFGLFITLLAVTVYAKRQR